MSLALEQKPTRIFVVDVLQVQSNSLQPLVLQGRKIYVIGDTAYMDSTNMAPGTIKIMNINSCPRVNDASHGERTSVYHFFCTDNVAAPQHWINNNMPPTISWSQPETIIDSTNVATMTLTGTDWNETSATLALSLNVQTNSGFCPYPFLGIVTNEYGYFIPERQSYQGSYCLNGDQNITMSFDDVPPTKELTIIAFDKNNNTVKTFTIEATSSLSATTDPSQD